MSAVYFFYYVDPWDGTQVTKFGSKNLYPVGHLVCSFLKLEECYFALLKKKKFSRLEIQENREECV